MPSLVAYPDSRYRCVLRCASPGLFGHLPNRNLLGWGYSRLSRADVKAIAQASLSRFVEIADERSEEAVGREALLRFTATFHLYHYFPPGVSFFQIPNSLGNITQRVAP